MAIQKLKQLEKEIQLGICDYLALRKHFFWRQNTMPVYDSTKQMYRPMPRYSLNGVPDILLIYKGRFIGLEVKRPGGSQSDNQKEFERRTKEAGGEYYIVTSLDDVIKLKL
jgi:hypothetical protein